MASPIIGSPRFAPSTYATRRPSPAIAISSRTVQKRCELDVGARAPVATGASSAGSIDEVDDMGSPAYVVGPCDGTPRRAGHGIGRGGGPFTGAPRDRAGVGSCPAR